MALDSQTPNDSDIAQSRLELLWRVIVFQFKLTIDGLRDLLLVPISLVAAVFGILFGGDQPARYFLQVLALGKRSERWLNLFGDTGLEGTADDVIKPIQERVFEEANNREWVRKAGSALNASIDSVQSAVQSDPTNSSGTQSKPPASGDASEGK